MIQLPIFRHEDTYQVNPTKIIALGLNYHAHIAESHSVRVRGFNNEIPEEPILFPKLPSCIIGHNETVSIPAFLSGYSFETLRTDYEGELAVIIKNKCRDVTTGEALGQIYGFTCANDISQRNLQHEDRSGWFRGKSLDTFLPLGPQVVLMEDLPNYQNLTIETRLNGKVVQKGNTGQMIFTIPEIVAFVSRNFTLMPGDILLTGTPSGVGPLSQDDRVAVKIEGIGILENRVQDNAQKQFNGL